MFDFSRTAYMGYSVGGLGLHIESFIVHVWTNQERWSKQMFYGEIQVNGK